MEWIILTYSDKEILERLWDEYRATKALVEEGDPFMITRWQYQDILESILGVGVYDENHKFTKLLNEFNKTCPMCKLAWFCQVFGIKDADLFIFQASHKKT